jgi:tetratricopeptide (TPR) repeat protein
MSVGILTICALPYCLSICECFVRLIFDRANLMGRTLAHVAPSKAIQNPLKELEKLQDVVESYQKLSETNPDPRLSHTEASLMQCAQEALIQKMSIYEASVAAKPVARYQREGSGRIRISEWVGILESLRRDQQDSRDNNSGAAIPITYATDEAHTSTASVTTAKCAVQESKIVDIAADNSDDDLDTELAKVALGIGTKAFEAQEWEKADSFLQEALGGLHQLPKQRRAFCDLVDMQYKLAVCAYHIQEPVDAKEALLSLTQQSASSSEDHRYTYDAAHLLSMLYIRMGQVDSARSECEKAVQGRRRLLGKGSDASLESTALMAHIWGLLNNPTRATAYLGLIPEARKGGIVKAVEESLGTKIEQHPKSSTSGHRSISSDSDIAERTLQNKRSASSLVLSIQTASDSTQAEIRDGIRSTSTIFQFVKVPTQSSLPDTDLTLKSKPLSRKDILERVGCQPRDRIEEAVCEGDDSALTNLLRKKKGFWQSKLRKHVRPERATALHYAALFGEIDMAQRLLVSDFNINEVPYGYSTSVTPLKFAIGARQVDMVEFLIGNGARPSEPESWSSLAGQLMNRSWLSKTMSDTEKEPVPSRITAILEILLKHGWNINVPFETSGRTVLHQAVAFHSGDFRWDLNLRTVVTSFLCERGADPLQTNAEGKTPYDLAMVSGHQDLLLILGRGSKKNVRDVTPMAPVELSG